MEDNKERVESVETTEKKYTYEELEQIAVQLQNRAMQAESRINTLNLTTMRLEYLFKVLDNAKYFPTSFVSKCVVEIVDILEIKKKEESTESSKE